MRHRYRINWGNKSDCEKSFCLKFEAFLTTWAIFLFQLFPQFRAHFIEVLLYWRCCSLFWKLLNEFSGVLEPKSDLTLMFINHWSTIPADFLFAFAARASAGIILTLQTISHIDHIFVIEIVIMAWDRLLI